MSQDSALMRIFITFIFAVCLLQASIAQRFISSKVHADSLSDKVLLNIYHFKNINKKADYYDADELKHIRKLEASKNWKKLYQVLSKYVTNFGIQNFYKDTKLIWRLAKLTELFGDPEDAKDLYRLVLRHHYNNINIHEIELYYDSLNQQETDLYVPLDYYYELVGYRKLIDTLRPPRGVLLNMGKEINSSKADYAPSLNVQNNILIFTSQRKNTEISLTPTTSEDLFFSAKDDYGNWTAAKELTELNSRYKEGSAVLTRDGQTIYFSRCDCSQCYGGCDLFSAKLQADSTWGEIKNLGSKVNSLSWDSHPSLSHSEDTLFFASDRLGGFGLSDIYFTYKDKKGNWTKAQNMGPIINTRNNDLSPFYHPMHNVLYFGSNGQLFNFGEYDIYKTYQIDNYWSEPINIGPLVNGKGSEYYFTIDNNSELLFYARSTSRNLSKQDIYSFPLPMTAQPLATTKLTGSLRDSINGKPFKGIVTIIDLDEGIEVAPKYLQDDGSFEFDLIDQRKYLLIIQGDDFFRIEDTFFLDGSTEIKKVTEPLASRVKFESIAFDNGKSNLKEEMYGDLNKIINFLYDNPDFKLKISGHTDSFGSEDFNLQLSRERAKNIRDYVVDFAGVASDRVNWEGHGSAKPIITANTEEAKALNRRVEFEIYRDATPNETEGDK